MNARPTVKSATTAAALHPILAERWSPRGFDAGHELTTGQITALLEAPRWAPSANNRQPWRFAVTQRGTDAFKAILSSLTPRNQAWAHAASALIVVAAETVKSDGSPSRWASYDTGQAVAHLTVQAEHEDLAVHQMGGFDRDRLDTLLELPAHVTPLVVVVAVGRRGQTSQLPEPFASREDAAPERRPLRDLLIPTESVRASVAA